MFGTQNLALFSLTVFVLNATPGVDMAFTLLSTLHGGIRAGMAAAAGVCAGCVVHTLAAAFGLAALMAASSAAFNAIKWAGAAYLLWLAIGMLRQTLRAGVATTASVTADTPSRSVAQVFQQGFLTNVLNPKVALFFLALLPQFIASDAPNKTAAFLFLGAWSIVQGFGFLTAFVLLVAPLRHWQPRAWVQRSMHGASAALFAALALRLALSSKP